MLLTIIVHVDEHNKPTCVHTIQLPEQLKCPILSIVETLEPNYVTYNIQK